MSRGGFRVGAGRPDGSRDTADLLGEGMPAPEDGETPMEYALRVMRDPNVDPLRRDRMCQVLMPYCHISKNRDGKKKEQAEKAEKIYEKYFVPEPPAANARDHLLPGSPPLNIDRCT